MALPVHQDGRLDYAAVGQELRARLRGRGWLDLPDVERRRVVHQAYWGLVWTWIVLGLSVLVMGWMIW